MANRVILVGRLGRDPEVRFTASGKPVANVSLATDESYKNNSGEWIKRTEWHRVVMFDALATAANDNMEKGRLIYIEGRLQTRQWDDKDGITRNTTEVVANFVNYLDKKPQASPPHPAEYPDYTPATHDDDVPF